MGQLLGTNKHCQCYMYCRQALIHRNNHTVTVKALKADRKMHVCMRKCLSVAESVWQQLYCNCFTLTE